MRDPYVEKIINKLKTGHKTDLRGIVTTDEVIRLCGMIRVILGGDGLNSKQRSRLVDFTRLFRRFTVAEADLILHYHGLMIKQIAKANINRTSERNNE